MVIPINPSDADTSPAADNDYEPRHNTVNQEVVSQTHFTEIENDLGLAKRFGARREDLGNAFPNSPLSARLGSRTLTAGVVDLIRQRMLNNDLDPDAPQNLIGDQDREYCKNHWGFSHVDSVNLQYHAPNKHQLAGPNVYLDPRRHFSAAQPLASPYMPNLRLPFFPLGALVPYEAIDASVPQRANPRPNLLAEAAENADGNPIPGDDRNEDGISDTFEEFVSNRPGLNSPHRTSNYMLQRLFPTRGLRAGISRGELNSPSPAHRNEHV